MHLVPIIPQPKVGVEESLEVTPIASLMPAKPVIERTLPPLVSHGHKQHAHTSADAAGRKERQVVRQEERRRVCRRLQHRNILEELRSATDRRRRQQRKTDVQLHIDEEV